MTVSRFTLPEAKEEEAALADDEHTSEPPTRNGSLSDVPKLRR